MRMAARGLRAWASVHCEELEECRILGPSRWRAGGTGFAEIEESGGR